MDALATNLRIAALSITVFDILQTIPGEYGLYKKAWDARRLSPVVICFFLSRYMGSIALITNCIGYFSTSFTIEECRRFHLVAPVTKMVAGLAAQTIIFLRTYAISRQSRPVFITLLVIAVLCFPLQVMGNVYLRYASVKGGNCTSRVNTEGGDIHFGPYYYLASLVFDVAACTIATYCVWQQSRGSSMSHFTRKILSHGVIYAGGTTLANLLCFLALLDLPVVRGLGSTLSIAIVLIMCQHLVLSTQKLGTFGSTDRGLSGLSELETGRDRAYSGAANNVRGQKFELSGIRVQTETYHHTSELEQTNPVSRLGAKGEDLSRRPSSPSVGSLSSIDNKRADFSDKY